MEACGLNPVDAKIIYWKRAASSMTAGRGVQKAAGRGVQKAVDTVGYDNDLDAVEALGFEGELVELVDVVRPQAYRDAFGRGLSFHQFSLGAAQRSGPAGQTRLVEVGQTVGALQEGGAIRPHISRVIPLEQVGESLVAMLQRTTVGKIVMDTPA